MKICIVGAGPAGLLLAQHLICRPNYEITLLEERPDYWSADLKKPLYSYPIALQGRGVSALREVQGMEDELRNFGKWIDTVSFVTNPKKKPRTMKRPRPTFMIQQFDLQKCMLRHLQSLTPGDSSKLGIHFDTRVEKIFLHNHTLVTSTNNNNYFNFDRVVAADGANSQLRILLAGLDSTFLVSRKSVPGGYKILNLSPEGEDDPSKENDRNKLDPNSIHGWMLKTQSFLAVPLREVSNSVVYAFTEDPDPFQGMSSARDLLTFMEKNIPSLAPLISAEEAEAFLARPTQRMSRVSCNRLTAGPNREAVLVGDAAHVFSASLNQGCNAALQDVQVLCQCLNDCGDDWEQALLTYEERRFLDIQAAHELSDYSFPKTAWQRVEFVGRMILHKLLPRLTSPLPMELIHDETLSYRDILIKCQGWIDRVKKNTETSLIAENFGKAKQKLLR